MAAVPDSSTVAADTRLSKINVKIESGVTPKTSEAYTKKDYWEWRFEREEEYDWLATYDDVSEFLGRQISVDDRILLVRRALVADLQRQVPRASSQIGCGNSTLTADMADAGFKHLTSTDISEVCIRNMQAKHETSHPHIEWKVADMLQLDAVFDPHSFDVVLDKAGMDAVLAHKGDVWEAPQELLQQTYTVCKQVQGVLAPGGVFLSLSFGQPHFRLQYFGAAGGDSTEVAPAQDVPRWESIKKEAVDVGFGYFWYILST